MNNLPQRSEVEVRGAKHASTAQHQFAYSVTFCEYETVRANRVSARVTVQCGTPQRLPD